MPCSPLKCIGGGRKGRHPTPNFFPSPLGDSRQRRGVKRKSAANLATRPSPPLPLSLSFSTCNFFLPPTPTSSSATPTTSILLPERRRKERKKGKVFSPFSRRRRHTKSTSSKNPLSLSLSLSLPCLVWGWWSRKTKKATFSKNFPLLFHLLSCHLSPPPPFPTLPRNEEAKGKEEVKALSPSLQTVNSPLNDDERKNGAGGTFCVREFRESEIKPRRRRHRP